MDFRLVIRSVVSRLECVIACRPPRYVAEFNSWRVTIATCHLANERGHLQAD